MKDMLFPTRAAQWTALLALLVLGFTIRLYDLTDPPLDFHPTRQLLSALKARGMYYEMQTSLPAQERDFAVQQWKVRAAIEPEIVERMAASLYPFTGEHIWVARLLSSLFWLIGAVFLHLLARRVASSDGALAATAIFLFLPYAVTASRSFQPDPLMVMFIVLFCWAIYEWTFPVDRIHPNLVSWRFAVLAGVFGGLSILVKFVAVFFVVGAGLGALAGRGSIKEAFKNPQVYLMGILGVLPGAAYAMYGIFIAGYLGQQFSGRFIPSLFLSPSYYLGWLGMVNHVTGGMVLMLALLGLFFLDGAKRRFFFGLWAGYAIFGIVFNYHISSHDYYSLPLIPIAAWTIAPLADAFFSQLAGLTPSRWTRAAAIGLLFFGVFAVIWNMRADMKSVDHRPQAAMWAEIKDKIGDASVAGLTEDYGTSAAYYGWMNLTPWPTSGDLSYHGDLRGAQADFDKRFANIAQKKTYFIVASFDELARQPLLKEKLAQYPVFTSGDGYIIYTISP